MTYVDDRGISHPVQDAKQALEEMQRRKTYNTPLEWWLTWCYTWAWIGMIFEVDCRHEFKRFYGNPLACQ